MGSSLFGISLLFFLIQVFLSCSKSYHANSKKLQIKHIHSFNFYSIFIKYFFFRPANICKICNVALKLKSLETPVLAGLIKFPGLPLPPPVLWGPDIFDHLDLPGAL